MNHFDRIYAIHKSIRDARHPISCCALQAKLECSRATVKRIMDNMRVHLGAPITYDRQANGYHYANSGEPPYELPGLWFTASELYALLTAQQLLIHAQPGLLDSQLAPLRKRIEHILESKRLRKGEIGRRVRIVSMAARKFQSERFQLVADALLQRKQLHIDYHGRSRNTESSRTISPQRLTHYRDNWYLDAWCHYVAALRSFALDRIVTAHTLEPSAIDISDADLETHFASAYGIFAGEPTHSAVLRFHSERARWVADEQWHPDQRGRFLEDGSYELTLPYSDPRELILDILKYGYEVEVIEPICLRDHVIDRLEKTLQNYKKA